MNRTKWLWLAYKCGPASSELVTLIEKLGDISGIYNASYGDYACAGISERLCEDLSDKSLDPIMPALNYCAKMKVGVLCYDDERYPMSLRSLKDPPAVLFYQGELPDLNKRLCISIVGTRRMSEYGMRAAYKIGYEVAASGAVVVSGMALGIDGIASAATIAAGGKTVAVLGCGIDRVYPPEHERLCGYIKKNGAVITEYFPGTSPKGSNFPTRNRLISGLSQGTVVIDADKSSGAMITARAASTQGKDIYAVPGNIDSETATGTNTLIRDGAQAVLCGNDVIANYAYLYRDSIDIQRLRTAERRSELDPNVIRRMGVSMRVYVDDIADGSKRYPMGVGIVESNYLTRKKRGNAQRDAEKQTRTNEPQRNGSQRNGPQKNEPWVNEPQEKPTSIPTLGADGNVTPVTSAGDNSSRIVDSLSEKQRKIFDEIPIDKAITVDYLTTAGFSMGEVMSTLTILEIKGLISSLPGALYVRK